MTTIQRKVKIVGEEQLSPLFRKISEEVNELSDIYKDFAEKNAFTPTQQLKVFQNEIKETLKGFDATEKGIAKALFEDKIEEFKKAIQELQTVQTDLFDDAKGEYTKLAGGPQDKFTKGLMKEKADEMRRIAEDQETSELNQLETKHKDRIQQAGSDKKKIEDANKLYETEKKAIRDKRKDRDEQVKLLEKAKRTASTQQSVLGYHLPSGMTTKQQVQSGVGGTSQSVAHLITSGAIGSLVGSIFGTGGKALGAVGGVIGGSLTKKGGVLGGAIGGLLGAIPAVGGAIGSVFEKALMESLEADAARGKLYGITGIYDTLKVPDVQKNKLEEGKKLFDEIKSKGFKNEGDKYKLLEQYKKFGIKDEVTKMTPKGEVTQLLYKDEKAKLDKKLEEDARKSSVYAFSDLGMKRSEALEQMGQVALSQGNRGNLTQRTLDMVTVSKAFGIDMGMLLEAQKAARKDIDSKNAAVNFERLRRIIYSGTETAHGDFTKMHEYMRQNIDITHAQAEVGEKTSSTIAGAMQAAFRTIGGKFESAEAQQKALNAFDRTIKGTGNQFTDAFTMRAIQEVGRQQGMNLSLADILDVKSKGLFGLTEGKALGMDVLQTKLDAIKGESFESRRLMLRSEYGDMLDADTITRLAQGVNVKDAFGDKLKEAYDVTGVSGAVRSRAYGTVGEGQRFEATMATTLGSRLGDPTLEILRGILQPLAKGELAEALKKFADTIITLSTSGFEGIKKMNQNKVYEESK